MWAWILRNVKKNRLNKFVNYWSHLYILVYNKTCVTLVGGMWSPLTIYSKNEM